MYNHQALKYKPEGKIRLEIHRCRLKDNIKEALDCRTG